jgi:hypothetical protein
LIEGRRTDLRKVLTSSVVLTSCGEVTDFSEMKPSVVPGTTGVATTLVGSTSATVLIASAARAVKVSASGPDTTSVSTEL